ncbi:MAG: nitrate reductase [Deltaproteobacteria bacterium]|nr:MAG: nitrate reductase [Deltaproteobacteria bacterium]
MNNFNSIYNFVSGPLVWLAFIVFIGGSIYRIWNLISLVNKKEKYIYTFMSLKYSLRSIMHWITPFATVNWRKRPVMTIITFVFHAGLVIMPFFVSAHVIMFHNAWGFSWGSLPESFTDAVTLLVIIACVIFLLRRLVLREVKFLTDASDYGILLMAAAPFITGFMAYHNIWNYHFWIILHILSGEIMLVAIPFTRLSHMLYAVFTRSYIGSEFGKVRHARDW